jgi:hypothetical protein
MTMKWVHNLRVGYKRKELAVECEYRKKRRKELVG